MTDARVDEVLNSLKSKQDPRVDEVLASIDVKTDTYGAGRKRTNSFRNRAEVERDRSEISELYLKGVSLKRITEVITSKHYPGYMDSNLKSKRLRLSFVQNDIQAIIKEWKATAVNNIDMLRAVEIEKINHLEQVYWEAWERSVGEKEQSTTERVEDVTTRLLARVVKTDSDGNAAFLAGIQWCIDKRCKLLGLDAPTKNEIKNDVRIHIVYDDKNPSDIIDGEVIESKTLPLPPGNVRLETVNETDAEQSNQEDNWEGEVDG
jgi:hypothetical protein